MNWRSDVPYDELPDLPPVVTIETLPVLKATIEARAALAALDQAVRRIPNPTVLINAIPLLEAQASSEIENIVTTADDLFKFAHDETAAGDPATKEALQYRTALFEGFDSLSNRPLSVTTATDICSVIKHRSMTIRSAPGTYIGNPLTKQAIYTPPTGASTIRDKLSNWQDFVHGEHGLDPVVVMAVAHYQFEAIHPFEDGNGRTGRILNILILVGAGLLRQPILYLSRYIIEHKAQYYALLQGVTEKGDWQSWVLYLIEGLRFTALSTVRKIDAISALQDSTRETIREVTTGGVNADLLAVLFEQPYCRIVNVMDRCSVSRPTATGWLNALVEAGVLRNVKAGRERLFINSAFLELLVRDESDSEIPDSLEPTLF